jgi:hypothetical protein
LEGSGYVKSDPKPKEPKKEKPKKDLTMMIVGAVAILGIITFAVIYFGGNSKKAEAVSSDSTLTNSIKTPVAVDTTALGQQADSLFNLPNYPEYARVVLKINEAYPANSGGHSKNEALQKLKKGAAGWEKYSLSEPDNRSFLEAFSNAILILDPYDIKGLELQKKLNK